MQSFISRFELSLRSSMLSAGVLLALTLTNVGGISEPLASENSAEASELADVAATATATDCSPPPIPATLDQFRFGANLGF